MPETWQDLRSLAQLLHSDLTGLQRLLSIEAAKSLISDAEARLLRDLSLVTDSAISYERSIERQAQIQTTAMAVEEAEETYKQARSMEKLTAIAWIYIPLSFSATFFGMNVAQLNESGPHIGYYFMLLAITLMIFSGTALLYTEWWRGKAFAWRERIQPGHTCRPRELSVAHLLWLTVRWALMEKILCGIRIPGRWKRSSASAADSGSV
ncbi:uncharacterized protein APUU_20331A [Aspergillus puulaauensis]|uniref:Uncharacterized protein n=1 Tax=Aspergillus puulaauensis TaxID=1220207 RepID=A0A7R8AHR0_9EURO|nr:uncharacterized protein APUU_20331A [Aspergillus puulaauensis]BCS19899.1 hypothetical protein APUU_20331A [Aspergillus puulaauensis]